MRSKLLLNFDKCRRGSLREHANSLSIISKVFIVESVLRHWHTWCGYLQTCLHVVYSVDKCQSLHEQAASLLLRVSWSLMDHERVKPVDDFPLLESVLAELLSTVKYLQCFDSWHHCLHDRKSIQPVKICSDSTKRCLGVSSRAWSNSKKHGQLKKSCLCLSLRDEYQVVPSHCCHWWVKSTFRFQILLAIDYHVRLRMQLVQLL